jgi:hypothetical protein
MSGALAADSATLLTNGQPGLVAQQDGVTVTVFAFDVAGGRDQAHLGSAQPRETLPLDERPTRVSIPSVR